MRRIITVLTVAVAAFIGGLAPASAVNIGQEGCTPGYWKNHTDNWQEAHPHTLFSDRFNAGTSGALVGDTFAVALAGGGGAGVAGAETILARAATAAYLNAAHEGLGYPWRRVTTGLDNRPPLVPAVKEALASGDRAVMLALASRLDTDNNLGCTLS